MQLWKKTAALLAVALLLAGCSGGNGVAGAETQPTAPEGTSQVADTSQMAPVQQVVEDGMEPIPGSALVDGVYPVTVGSSSEMFQVTSCELSVTGGEMVASMHMGGTGYLKLFMGTGEQAASAPEADCIPFEEQPDGSHVFTVPVEALDKGIGCAAFSKKKGLWYDRTLVFRADSLPLEAFRPGVFQTVESLGLADGDYTVGVVLEGGSGRASVESPAALRVEGGSAFVTIVWGSSNYDYMKLDGVQYGWAGGEGNSAFELPVAVFDRKIAVSANTNAMSTPHEIEYTLCFDSATVAPAV